MYIISIKTTRKEITVQGQQELKDKSFQSYNKIHREGREKKSDFFVLEGSNLKASEVITMFFGFVGFFLFKFISLTFGPDQLEHPIDQLVQLL